MSIWTIYLKRGKEKKKRKMIPKGKSKIQEEMGNKKKKNGKHVGKTF
jgi:hypothetical protein